MIPKALKICTCLDATSYSRLFAIDSIYDTDGPGYDMKEAKDGTVWSFTAAPANTALNPPTNPSPANHATGVLISPDLSWTGGDPDAGDMVTYDVYFGTSATPPQMSNDQVTTSYDPGTLSDDTEYYWQIVATDNHGASTTGPVWDFSTGLPGATVTWDLPWGLDADPSAVNIWTYHGDALAVTLADVDWSMPSGLLIWHYGGPTEGWRFYKKGWGAVNTLGTLTPGKGYIGIVPTASVWEIPQG